VQTSLPALMPDRANRSVLRLCHIFFELCAILYVGFVLSKELRFMGLFGDYKKNISSKVVRSLSERRALFAKKKTSIIYPKVKIFKNKIHLNGNIFNLKIFRPLQKRETYPTVFFIPGTGFTAREESCTEAFCSFLVEYSNWQVIVLDHRLAPEYKFPIPYQDVSALFYFFTKVNAVNYRIDTSKVVLSGYSSGGNLASILAIDAKKNGCNILKNILISPLVDLSCTIKGYEKFEEADISCPDYRGFVKWIAALYLPTNVSTTNPHASPLFLENAILEGSPPTDIIFSEHDFARGDGELFKEKLQACNVNTDGSHMFPDSYHRLLWSDPEKIAKKIATNIG
jgi:acetyl esterase/lipase